MQRELDENSHKGDWNEWKPSKAEVLQELYYHISKLGYALLSWNEENHKQISEYCADSANILMKIDELYKL